MNRLNDDDMTKTIEELAKQYAEDMCPIRDYCGDVYDEQRNSDLPIYIDDAKSVLGWLFAKPLAQRLTPEEKERLRYIRYEILRGCDRVPTGWDFSFQCAIKDLEILFGADFSKEDKI